MSGKIGWRGLDIELQRLFPPPPTPTEACSNTTVWDFDVTVFIVVYSCSSTLSFRRPSPGKPLESPSAMANLQAKSWPHRLRPRYPQLYYSLPPPLRQGSAKAH
ncbi:hypothetical protein Q8A67_024196 [Cirrhinus molitorella]|uniref:Uncharacterized protein n=1 Tax=Cirrhinus molitorella TaxID=172907 RepID=A0AA88P4J0_9TELE|nr:hypothetical protein Q8A67_024196 [Cirrhinus molitorella]